jgi:GH15 family glucan-1,4-alpha-glucosidase
MARPIILSNGELHVGINKYGLVHDFYFPYVGLENHAAGQSLRHQVGVWIDGRISWLDSSEWVRRFDYPHHSLIGHIVVTNQDLGVQIEFDDAVDATSNSFMRSIHVINLRDYDRNIRLFMHQAFDIGDARSNTDTAQYLPSSKAVLHYRGRRAFVVSGMVNDKPFDQYTVGLFGIEGHEGTYRDADDGELSFCNVEHGRVDSTLRFFLDLKSHDSARVHYWITAGISTHEAIEMHRQLAIKGVSKQISDTAKWWQDWIQPAERISSKLSPKYKESFLRSIMLMKAHTDRRGAVIASTDTTMLNYSRDAYGYCWPRDGAYVLWPLIRMGYTEEPLKFFEFCRRGLHADGYLAHKYRADGALGSSWHPYLHAGGVIAPPIQEDETALVLYVFAQFYQTKHNPVLLHDFYKTMVMPMANFLSTYINDKTGLPRASYDLWEEVFSTSTYTVAVTYAALLAAAELAEDAKDADNAVKWRSVAGDMQAAAHKYLFNENRNAFYKGINVVNNEIEYNQIVDLSSVFGCFMYGLFTPDSDEMKAALRTIEELFGLSDESFGLPRYENDYYRRVSNEVTGNWWPICSLWIAQYYIDRGEKYKADRIISWVQDRTGPSGILSEQLSPYDGSPVSVAPLAWSHAEYVSTLLDTIE